MVRKSFTVPKTGTISSLSLAQRKQVFLYVEPQRSEQITKFQFLLNNHPYIVQSLDQITTNPAL